MSRRFRKYAQIEVRRSNSSRFHSMSFSSFRVMCVSIITGHSSRFSMRHGSIHRKKKNSERSSLIRYNDTLYLDYPPSCTVSQSEDNMIIISERDICTEIIPNSWESLSIFYECIFSSLFLFFHEEIGSWIGRIEKYIVTRIILTGILSIPDDNLCIPIDLPDSILQSCIEDR